MKVIGITGNIASGKNLVSLYLQRLKYPVFDADAVVHKLYIRDKNLILKIQELCPQSIENNCVNRKKLARYLAEDHNNWQPLEKIVHPVIMQELHKFLCMCRRQRYRSVVINMPLLFEIGADKLCDLIILVRTSAKIQYKRLVAREGYEQSLAKMVIRKQRIHLVHSAVIRTGLEKVQVFYQLIKVIAKNVI